MSSGTDLYERDFVAWTKEQAAQLRAAGGARLNLPIDWENLAEEIETLGRSEARELRSRVTTVVEHLLTLRWSPAKKPAATWAATVKREREAIEDLLAESPSLRQRVPAIVASVQIGARDRIAGILTARGEITVSQMTRLLAEAFTPEQVLGDWWPERAVAQSA
jgi:Flp pilus assembly CpaE family ATPase